MVCGDYRIQYVELAMDFEVLTAERAKLSHTHQLKVTRNKYPTLRRGNAASDAGALPDEFPRWSVGTRQNIGGIFSAYCLRGN